jgi:hypothetical protein
MIEHITPRVLYMALGALAATHIADAAPILMLSAIGLGMYTLAVRYLNKEEDHNG